METEEAKEKTINRIEKKIWQLILLAVVVILYLTLALLGMQFSGFLGAAEIIVVFEKAYIYSIFLCILILLFCAYLIIQQKRLLRTTRAFLREKETAYRLSQSVKILSTLLEVSSVINTQQRLSDILDTIVREMVVCFQADQSSIMLLDQESKMVKTAAACGKGSEVAKDGLVELGRGIAGRVVETGEPLLLDGEVDPRDFPGTLKTNRRISSAMCVPLKIGGKSIGALNVNLMDRDRTFHETELKLITVFANNISAAIRNALLRKEKAQRVRLQIMLEQFHSPQVVKELIKRIDDVNQPAIVREKSEVTILFADIRRFSEMLNVLELEDIMGFLDEYYSVMTETVFDNGGSIDKFIGDEVMAFFGAPVSLRNSTENGVKTAFEMLAHFQELKEKFSRNSPHFEKLGIGIGLNTGEAFVGNVGSKSHYDYTVIGNAVNLARRLCSHAESAQILTTERSLEKIDGMVSSEFISSLSLKGIPNSVRVHRISPLQLGIDD